MKIWISAIMLLLSASSVTLLVAQQNVQYNQFTYNELRMNPAYVGSHDIACGQAITRNQWIGFEGVSEIQSANFHTPLFGDNVGMAISINRDILGSINNLFSSMNYSHRIPIKKGNLVIGMEQQLLETTVSTA